MYPFIPDFYDAAFLIKSKFEKGCKGLDLQIIANLSYYKPRGGILDAAADVYEVDSVFLDDFVAAKRPRVPSTSVLDAVGPVMSSARNIAAINGKQVGVPHWLCSDFLIHRKDHPQLQHLEKPGDAATVFSEPGQGFHETADADRSHHCCGI